MDKIKNAFTVASQHIPQEQLSTKFSTVVNGSTVATIVFVDAAGHLVSPAATYAKETAALAAELAKHASGDAIAYTKQHPYRVAGSIPFGGAAGLAAVPLKALGFGPAGPVAGEFDTVIYCHHEALSIRAPTLLTHLYRDGSSLDSKYILRW